MISRPYLVTGFLSSPVSAPPQDDPVDTLTTAQMQALLEGWTPSIVGQDNTRQLLATAVRNRVRLGRITADDIRAVAA